MEAEQIKAIFIILYFILSIVSGIIWAWEIEEDRGIVFVVACGFSPIALPLYFLMKKDSK